MIDYAKTNKGDILRVCEPGAPGWCKIGDLVRVKEVNKNGVVVENAKGVEAEFVYNCGAARLEPTEWTGDFDLNLNHGVCSACGFPNKADGCCSRSGCCNSD